MMFPAPMPPMPPEIMDAAAADPAGFADAMATGMEAFQGAMGEAGDMGAAFEAMGDVMGPIMQDMGVSPEAFEAAGDAVGAAIGGGMHMAPADCGGAEMGAICQDAVEMMMPPGMEVPAPVMDAMGDMGQGMADAGCMPHDVAGEMMPPPGDPGFPFPCDPAGECMIPPGDPAACPADICAPPPMDGACADMGGGMMPPDGGYDHAPMPADAVMPPPMEMGEGYIDPAVGMEGTPPPPGDMAAPPPGDMAAPPPGDMAAPPPGDMAEWAHLQVHLMVALPEAQMLQFRTRLMLPLVPRWMVPWIKVVHPHRQIRQELRPIRTRGCPLKTMAQR